MDYRRQRKWTYRIAAAPALGFLLLQVVPLGYAVETALTDAQGNLTAAHLRRVFADSLFLRGAGYNLLVPVVSVAVEAVVGVAMALWFFRLRRGKAFWRTVAIVPFAVPEIVYLLTMKLLFRQHGYLNSLLYGFGGNDWTVGWLRPGTALMVIVIILVDAWRVTPVVFLIVLMALEQLPASFLEAAEVDGATRWQVTWRIQIPLVVPALLIALALRAVDAFRIFATPLVLVGVQELPVLTSVAYHYQVEANDPAAANVASLTLGLALLLATAAALVVISSRRRKTGFAT